MMTQKTFAILMLTSLAVVSVIEILYGWQL